FAERIVPARSGRGPSGSPPRLRRLPLSRRLRGGSGRVESPFGATWPRALACVLPPRPLSPRFLSRGLAYVPSDHSRDVEVFGDLEPKRGKRPVRAGVIAEDFRRRLLLLERLSVRIDRNDLAVLPPSA